MGLGIVFFIVQGIVSPDLEREGLFDILNILTNMMAMIVLLLSLMVVASWLFDYFDYFASLLFSGVRTYVHS